MSPENIAIHIVQNAVNFISTSVAWVALGALTSRTQISRDVHGGSYSSSPEETLPSYSVPSLRSNGDNSGPFRSVPIASSSNSRGNLEDEKEERERLYEFQVQEYRKQKEMEAMRQQQKAMLRHGDQNTIRPSLKPQMKTMDDGLIVDENDELQRRLIEMENHKKIMQMKSGMKALKETQENYLRKRVGESAEQVYVKSKGSPVKRKRKIKKVIMSR